MEERPIHQHHCIFIHGHRYDHTQIKDLPLEGTDLFIVYMDDTLHSLRDSRVLLHSLVIYISAPNYVPFRYQRQSRQKTPTYALHRFSDTCTGRSQHFLEGDYLP